MLNSSISPPPFLHKSEFNRRNSTKSLTGSLFEQILENNRHYCNESYYLPNDEQEQIRTIVTHQAYLKILSGQLSMARLSQSITRVLDIGTGTGDWAIAIAERFPEAEVVATDISIFGFRQGPSNLFFEVDDAREDWTYTEPFDFIHIRGLAGAFHDWGHIYRGVYKHLKMNGYCEIADFGPISLLPRRNGGGGGGGSSSRDPSSTSTTTTTSTTSASSSSSPLATFNWALTSAAEKAGTPIGLAHLQRSTIEQSGLRVINSKTLDIPVGEWSRDPRLGAAGRNILVSALEGLEAMSLRLLTRELGWTEEGVRQLCGEVVAELIKPGVRATIQCMFVIVRKVL